MRVGRPQLENDAHIPRSQVPVLEDVCSIHPIAGELDVLITHKDQVSNSSMHIILINDGLKQKAFQVWSLDAGLKGTEITARLKKRPITPHAIPGDYVGPTCIGGNYNQFILSAASCKFNPSRRGYDLLRVHE